jgi:hypothetical protein
MKSWVVMFSLALSGLAQAQITPELAANFLEKQTLEAYPSLSGERIDILKLMRAAPPGDPLSIVPLLAKQWNATEDGAAKIIEAVMLEETRLRGYPASEESEAMTASILRLYNQAFDLSPDSPQIWKFALERHDGGLCDDTARRAIYLDRPVAKAQYPRQGQCPNWYIEYARRFPDSALARVQMHIAVRNDDPAAEIASIRWALDSLEARREPDDFERAVRQWHWNLLSQHGLGDELLAEVAANAKRYSSPFAKPPHEKLGIDGVVVLNDWMLRSQAAGARVGWMLALLEAGRGDEARAAFDAALDGDGVTKDALFGNTEDDLFDRYLADPENSLLWKTMEGRLVDRGVARFLEANGMKSAARHASTRACWMNEDSDGEGPLRELAGLTAEFRAHHEHYQRVLAAAEIRANCPAVSREVRSTRLPRYPEVPLTSEERARPVLPRLDMKFPLPESFGIVRAERRGDEVLALCESSAVDPSGEIGAGGYWLLRSRNGGKSWHTPHYLGLQSRSPYLAKHDARLSMFAGDALRIEADVAELDPESITFPPIGLRNRREVSDIRIDIPFADIERDTDGDGWTDLLEAKLHTDPAKADTDGDGLGDALDDFPQASARGTPDPDAALIVDLLKRIMGFERAGIVEPVVDGKGSKSLEQHLSGIRRRPGAGSVLFQIVVGDPARFAGLRAESQVIVLSEAQVREIRATSGPFYPLEFPEILFDAKRERAIVTWSAGWVGGTLLYRKVKGRWTGKEVSQWITDVTPAPRTSPG